METEFTSQESIRKKIDGAEWVQAHVALKQLWQEASTQSNAGWIISSYKSLRPHLPFSAARLAVLRSFTLEPALPLLQAEAFTSGIDLTVQVGDFNAYVQEILNPSSNLYQFAPTVVILAVQTRDIAPELWNDYADLSAESIQASMERILDTFRNCIRAFRANSQAHLIVHTLEQPALPSRGIFDVQTASSQQNAIQEINRKLREIAAEYKGVYLLDYDALVARYGHLRWLDEGKWLSVRMPVSADHLIYLAREWMRYLLPLTGKIAKVLVVDLDNTLWGGVIGEDGLAGIKLGVDYPGNAYRALQRAILDLYQRGIVLAICSKNNASDALEVFEKHPDMILRQEHFAAMRINWQDKARNLREIASELNVGVDALAFLDDNPAERALVQQELPEVKIIDLPKDPARFSNVLRECPFFERLSLSREDYERNRYYAEDRQRNDLKSSAESIEDFYRSLQMEAEIEPASVETFARVAQLTQKTNQFNLTTRRYSEQQISEFAASPDKSVYTVRVRDRFGDNGLVGVTILTFSEDVCEIDTLLLSCRVIGRTVETALLAHVVEVARARGGRYLRGWFLPTKKNAPASEVYPAHGFDLVRQDETGSLWELDLEYGQIAFPEWIDLGHRQQKVE
jgi:FkbH-like protein